MGKIIAIVNQKGGVGKTTTAVNLAACLRQSGARVLLCDFDPQANATSGLGVTKRSRATIYDAIVQKCRGEDAVVSTPYVDLIPSSPALSGLGIELVTEAQREFRLRQVLEPLKNRYDYLFIDCPPSLELLTLNGLCAAESILVPVQCEYYALEGLSDLMTTMRAVKKGFHPHLEIFGVLLTMYDGRVNLSLQVAEEVRRHFPGKVFTTVIPRNVRLSEAPSHGMPVIAYDKYCRGAEAYMALAKEIQNRRD